MNARTDGPSSAHIIPIPAQLARQIDQFLKLVGEEERFLVTAHKSPDGDAIGSMVAMAAFLEALGKEVVMYNRDPAPYNYQFLEGADRIVHQLPTDGVDVAIMLDCGEPGRVGEEFVAWLEGKNDAGAPNTKFVAVVDHHKTYDAEFADYYVRDVSAAAAGELVWRIGAATKVEITQGIAEALYCCLMTDTGSFRYSNTSRTTFRIAGELIEAGVEPWRMTSEIYESQPRERLELLGMVLETLQFSDCGRLAFIRVEQAMLEKIGVETDLTDGFINYARSIEGVEVATQLRQLEDELWRVSFRSRGDIDVSEIAQQFGGGGHRNAAGCTIAGSVEEVTQKICAALR